MRVRCVGGILRDEAGRLLMVRRRNPPGEGLWSIPGGRVEPGEDDPAAVARELKEETGLDVVAGTKIGTVERPGPGGVVYEVHDYAATVADGTGGTLRAGDDASDVRWIPPDELRELPVTPGLLDALTLWGLL
ncbi:NUDIX hydrolase [Actinomadura sp. 9N215]|uniref:NUDIX hydrolase n=1 Tax=Actinomadura sp. 9N215 TaxID=3375150 RepID=UPI0037A4B7F0